MVGPNGIEVRTNGGDRKGPVLPAAAVIDYLGKLPDRAWPYGLVVAVEEFHIITIDNGPRIARNSSELMPRLRDEGIRIEHW